MKTFTTVAFVLAIIFPLGISTAQVSEATVLAQAVGSNNQTTTSQESPTQLSNPLRGTNGEIDDIGELFDDILSNIIIPLTLAVGVLFIVLAGLRFVMATGSPDKLKKAKDNLLYTVIGVAVVLSAEILLDVLLSTLKEIGNVG